MKSTYKFHVNFFPLNNFHLVVVSKTTHNFRTFVIIKKKTKNKKITNSINNSIYEFDLVNVLDQDISKNEYFK